MKGEKISRTSTIVIPCPVETAFTLFDPIREKLWVPGWSPEIIYPRSGEIQEEMIFKTPARYEGEDPYIWTVILFDPDNTRVKYAVATTDRNWFVTVKCIPAGQFCLATVTYTYVGLSEAGSKRNQQALEAMFGENLKDWERLINAYLKSETATLLTNN